MRSPLGSFKSVHRGMRRLRSLGPPHLRGGPILDPWWWWWEEQRSGSLGEDRGQDREALNLALLSKSSAPVARRGRGISVIQFELEAVPFPLLLWACGRQMLQPRFLLPTEPLQHGRLVHLGLRLRLRLRLGSRLSPLRRSRRLRPVQRETG